ncbi:MAG: hypothetical protein M3096_05455 [Actinomycetia bacterium]|nr:hypothetical protein [Actinomycetes bacterium]
MNSMNPSEIDSVLGAAEEQIATQGTADLRGLGFWRTVGVVKRDPALIDRFADRIGAIDQAVFVAWAPVTIPTIVGTVVAVLATIVGLALIGASNRVEPWNGLLFLAGTGVLLAATHGLGHLVVGRIVGIRFTVWFAGYRRPQPGVKTNYATYLRTPARSRAWMHASGAIVTKAIPFLLLPVAIWFAVPVWTIVVLVVLAVGQVLTDVLWSTKASDWAKFRREMRYAP